MSKVCNITLDSKEIGIMKVRVYDKDSIPFVDRLERIRFGV